MVELRRVLERDAWSIFDDLASVEEEVNRLFAGPDHKWGRRRCAYPPLNVWSSDQGIVVDAELPGVDAGKVDIAVEGRELRISGAVGTDTGTSRAASRRRERPTGEFARHLQLPFRAEPTGVKANYRNGILRITVPKAEEDKPRRIAIETA